MGGQTPAIVDSIIQIKNAQILPLPAFGLAFAQDTLSVASKTL